MIHDTSQHSRHIVHIVYSLDIGGLERVLINTINGLPQFRHSVIALTNFSPRFTDLLPDDIQIHALNKPNGQSWSMFPKVTQLLKSLNPDVLHTYNLATLEYQVCGFWVRVPNRIHAEHGRDIFDPDGSNKKYQWLRRLMSPFVHHWVSVSNELHQWINSVVKISTKKTKLIYNGVDTSLYQPDKKQVLDVSQSGKFVFGCVGRLAPIKDHHLLIKAFELACAQSDEFANGAQLTLVGDGELTSQITSQIAKSNYRHQIWQAGARMDMTSVYQSFDWFVMSSQAEGVPMTALEAMACGKPVLAPNVGGLGEIVTSRRDGLLFESRTPKELARLMIDIFTQRPEYRDNARQKAESKFSEKLMLNQYKTMYLKD